MNNERVTLAQELHDGIAQDLVVLGFSIDQAIAQCQEADLKSSLRMMRFTTTTLIEKVRAEIHQGETLFGDALSGMKDYFTMRP